MMQTYAKELFGRSRPTNRSQSEACVVVKNKIARTECFTRLTLSHADNVHKAVYIQSFANFQVS